jgi:hypothetical protein
MRVVIDWFNILPNKHPTYRFLPRRSNKARMFENINLLDELYDGECLVVIPTRRIFQRQGEEIFEIKFEKVM